MLQRLNKIKHNFKYFVHMFYRYEKGGGKICISAAVIYQGNY